MIKEFAPLLFAGFALLGDYSAIQNAKPTSNVEMRSNQMQGKVYQLKRTVRELVDGYAAVEEIYFNACQVVAKTGRFDGERYKTLLSHLRQIRELEAALKLAVPPGEIAAEHLQLRKAVARVRSRLAQLESIHRQIVDIHQHVFDSDINHEGLKVLATVSTTKLATMNG